MARQSEIPGTESPDRDPELHALGLELYDLQSRRMKLTRDEKAKRIEIGALMHKKGLTDYYVDNVELKIVPGAEKVKVKVNSGSSGEDDEE